MTRRRDRRFSIGGLYSRGVVRTRGFVPVSAPEEVGGVPVRMRGAVHTRGEPTARAAPWQELSCEELGAFLEELRESQDSFPITIVAENPQAPETQAFLRCLKNLLGDDDVLWVVGEGTYEEVVPEELQKEFVPKDAYLNVKDQDKVLVKHTLTPELIFVAAASAEELKEQLEKWERRVLAVILAGPVDLSIPKDLALGIPGKEGDRWRRWWRRGE